MYAGRLRDEFAAADGASFRQFERSPVQLALLDAAGEVVFLNEAFKTWLAAVAGRPNSNGNLLQTIAGLVGRSTSRATAVRWSAFLSCSVDSVSATVELPRHGAARWFRISGTRFNSGGDAQMLFISEDVTQAHEAELAAKDLRNRLLASRESERQLISEELHDSTVQHLVGVDLNLMRLKARLKGDAAAQEILNDIELSVASAMQELRVSTYLLHPPDLENDGLELTLRRYCEGFARRTDLAVRFDSDGTIDRLVSPAQKAILRIVQEALTNVHRHAEATQVVVRCRAHGNHLHIVVSDNGLASSKAEPAQVRAGVGLASMRMRLAQFGGGLTISSAMRGTVVHCVRPLQAICKAAHAPPIGPVLARRACQQIAERYPH
jgi:signal transduction histidine kinase